MSDDADLQAKIAAIAGRINRHKTGAQAARNTTQPHHNSRYQQRWTPYMPAHSTTFKNRTLVNASAPSDNGTNYSATPQAEAAFVRTRGINNQLMTQSTYQREQQTKQALPLTPRPSKRPRIDDVHKRPSVTADRLIDIGGLKFVMKEDGSKLIRKDGRDTDTYNETETPRRAVIAGVEFLRTKNGNLLRAAKDTTRNIEQARPQCENFTKNGTCPFGPKCRFGHDAKKVAMCKVFLRKGNCPNGEYCDLSHKPTYHRAPACLHFQKDACNNESCRYPHVRTKPGAAVCRPFATLGYCDKGTDCEHRHVFECPDYANTGSCPHLAKCALPHILRASTERTVIEDDDSEIEDDNETFLNGHSSGTQLADNEDYVALR